MNFVSYCLKISKKIVSFESFLIFILLISGVKIQMLFKNVKMGEKVRFLKKVFQTLCNVYV